MRARLALLVCLLCIGFAFGAFAETPASYVIIVNPSNPQAAASRHFLSDVFLKKNTRWQNGEVIRPVDQDPDSAVRRKFSEEVLNRSVTAVRSYWQQVIFSGRDVPPPELASDAEVVSYVLKNAGAVGYVARSANLNGAKVISVQ